MPTKVGAEFLVNVNTNLDQSEPRITTLVNGNFVVAWQDSSGLDGDGWGVFARIFTAAGAPVSAELAINSYTAGTQADASIAGLTNGGFVVTWNDSGQDGSSWGVYGRVFAATGTPVSSEFRVNSYTTSLQRVPVVTSFTNGNFAVAWSSDAQDTSGNGIYARIFTAAGVEAVPEFRVNSYISSNQCCPSITGLTNGNFVVTWTSEPGQDGALDGVYARIFTAAGAEVVPEFRVNTYTTDRQFDSSVAGLTNGNFIVTWQSVAQDSSGYGVYGQLFTATGSTVFSEFLVNTHVANNQDVPSVASLNNGNFVVTWGSFGQDGSDEGVYGQMFTDAGVKVSSEFQINTYTTNKQGNPSVASLANGNFVVAWNSNGQDGSNYGVYGQVVSVSDPTTTTSLPANQSPSNAISPAAIAAIVVGTIGGIAAIIGLAYLYYVYKRRKADALTRENHVFANTIYELLEIPDVENFESEKGSLFVKTVDALSKDLEERHHIAVSTMDEDDIRLLALTVVNVIRQCVSPEAIYCGLSSVITEDGIRSSLVKIADSVKVMQEQELEKAAKAKQEEEMEIVLPIISYDSITFKGNKDDFLGEGGFGEVRCAQWQHTDVAVKQLKIQRLSDDSLREFKEEAKRHAALRHPNVVILYGVSLEAGRYCMVMELMVKGSLYAILHNAKNELPWTLRLSIAKDIIAGLAYLHDRNIIHRDIKSQNVLLDGNMRAKLSDFGLSQVKTETMSAASSQRASGTLPFMAPELFDLKPAFSKSSDIYAFAMLLWEIAARERPFKQARMEAIPHLIGQGKREDIPQTTPPPIAALITRCWEHRSEDRPATSAVATELMMMQLPPANAEDSEYRMFTRG